ncbi:MAG TPA: hypothetical protein VEP90_25600, partial [Methylomirabilota bacterium]|nr:hypothetical protein [Methylomirabilota bacterium]
MQSETLIMFTTLKQLFLKIIISKETDHIVEKNKEINEKTKEIIEIVQKISQKTDPLRELLIKRQRFQ